MSRVTQIVTLNSLEEEFLATQINKNMIMLLFRQAKILEKQYNKSLYAFNLNEALTYLKSLKSTSVSTIQAYQSILASYADFAEERGYTEATDSAWHLLNIQTARKCVSKRAQQEKIFTRQQIINLINDLQNPCDQFMILAFFEGFMGSMFEDIWDIELKDFNLKNNTAILPSGRIIKVSDKLLELAQESAETFTYFPMKINGERMSILAPDCTKVFKYRCNTIQTDNPAAAKRRVTGHMVQVKSWTGNSAITIQRLANSGMLEMIGKLAKKEGMTKLDFLSHPKFEEVRNQYGITATKANLKNRLYGFLDDNK